MHTDVVAITVSVVLCVLHSSPVLVYIKGQSHGLNHFTLDCRIDSSSSDSDSPDDDDDSSWI